MISNSTKDCLNEITTEISYHEDGYSPKRVILRNGSIDYVYKDPITDPSKKSIAGIIDVCYDVDGNLQVVKVPNIDYFESVVSNSVLNLVFENGVDYTRATFEQVRAKILSNM